MAPLWNVGPFRPGSLFTQGFFAKTRIFFGLNFGTSLPLSEIQVLDPEFDFFYE